MICSLCQRGWHGDCVARLFDDPCPCMHGDKYRCEGCGVVTEDNRIADAHKIVHGLVINITEEHMAFHQITLDDVAKEIDYLADRLMAHGWLSHEARSAAIAAAPVIASKQLQVELRLAGNISNR